MKKLPGLAKNENAENEDKKKGVILEQTNAQIEKLNLEINKFKAENERIKRMKAKYEELIRIHQKEKE